MNPKLNHKFIIESWGRTGTQSIAEILSNHQDCFCSHGPSLDLEVLPSARVLTDFERNTKMMPEFYRIGIEDFFQIMISSKNKFSTGNIHAYTKEHFNSLSSGCSSKTYAYITRNPIIRIESFVRRWKYVTNNIQISKKNMLGKHQYPTSINDINFNQLGINLKLLELVLPIIPKTVYASDILFLRALQVMDIDADSISKSIDFTYKFETLFSDSDEMTKFCLHIANTGSTKSWRDIIIKNYHIDKRQTIYDPDIIYNLWEDWQKIAFKSQLNHDNKSYIYKRIGYLI